MAPPRELPPPTREFCDEVRERVRASGWDYDYVETENFARGLYTELGLTRAEIDALDWEERRTQ